MDPRVIAACDSETLPTILDRHGDMTWLKKAESYISSILMKDNPTNEEKKDLKVFHQNSYRQISSFFLKNFNQRRHILFRCTSTTIK